MTNVVYNKAHRHIPRNAIYIGRPTKWGNPFHITRSKSREQVIELFRQYLIANPALLADVRRELAGKDLVCFCAPQACHGDVLLRVAAGGQP